MGDVTSSYKKLCRIHHPDINNDPESEELMKKINIAYTVLREKLKREAAFRERAAYTFSRPIRRYTWPEPRQDNAEARRTAAEAEKQAYTVLHNYFKAISAFDYSAAYEFLSSYDKRRITRESFIEWRTSVARLFPMREFTVEGSSTPATVTFSAGRTIYARKFGVMVTEEDLTENKTHSDSVDKLVISESGMWRVFLGYRNVFELTRTFDERFEAGQKREIAKHWEEYYDTLSPEYNMQNLAGLRKSAAKELYRQRRYGGTLTFAAISLKVGNERDAEHGELLRSAAKTIKAALRETDIPAYIGDGVFAVLFVELSNDNAENIVSGLVNNIRKGAGQSIGERADIKYAHETWSGSGYADTETFNKVLKKFRKKL